MELFSCRMMYLATSCRKEEEEEEEEELSTIMKQVRMDSLTHSSYFPKTLFNQLKRQQTFLRRITHPLRYQPGHHSRPRSTQALSLQSIEESYGTH